MRKAILTILLAVSDALLLSAGSLQGRACAETECRDTIRIADTVWMASPVPQAVKVVEQVRVSATPADPVLDDTFDRGIGKATALFVPKGTLAFGLTASYSSYDFGNATDDVGYKMLFSLLNGLNASLRMFPISLQTTLLSVFASITASRTWGSGMLICHWGMRCRSGYRTCTIFSSHIPARLRSDTICR